MDDNAARRGAIGGLRTVTSVAAAAVLLGGCGSGDEKAADPTLRHPAGPRLRPHPALPNSVVTVPFGIVSLRIAGYALWPFGRTTAERPGAEAPSFIGNVVSSIIGIPFGWANLKLPNLADATGARGDRDRSKNRRTLDLAHPLRNVSKEEK